MKAPDHNSPILPLPKFDTELFHEPPVPVAKASVSMKRVWRRHAGDAWLHVVDDKSAGRLQSVFSRDIHLDTSMLSHRLHGPPAVAAFFDAFTELCETLTIQDEIEGDVTTYLVWSGAAFNGRPFDGVTSLSRGERGEMIEIKVLCEPFDMLLRFSATLTQRLDIHLPKGVD